MLIETEIDIDAPASVAWAVLTNIPQWPTWTDSVDSVESANVTPLRPGASAALSLRGGPTTEWVVTEVNAGESFTWEAKMLGVTSTAGHVVESRPGGCRVRLSVQHSGPGAMLLRPFLRRVTLRNLALEAAGLKRRSEELSFAA